MAEALSRSGAVANIVSLVRQPDEWAPGALGRLAYSAPWLNLSATSLKGTLNMVHWGAFQDRLCEDTDDDVSSDWRAEWLLEREFRRISGADPDCVAMVYPRSHQVVKCVARVCRRLGWRIVVVANEALTDVHIDTGSRDRYIKCVVEHADVVWAVSHHLAEFWLAHGMPYERIWVAPTIVSPRFFDAEVRPRRDDVAVYVGNLAHSEVSSLLEIAQLVKERRPSFELVIYGDSDSAGRERLASRGVALGLSSTVRVESPVPVAELPSIIAAADVLMLPRASGEFSTAGFPNKLAEYLASGRPCVVTAVGDIPRYLIDGQSAYLVPPDDNRAFAEKVVEVLANPESADTVGLIGRGVARAIAESDQVARAFLETVSATPRRGPGREPRPRTRPCRSMARLARIELQRVGRWSRSRISRTLKTIGAQWRDA